MRKLIAPLICVIALLAVPALASCTGEPAAAPPTRVLVIHSYHEGWGWNQDIQGGIVEGLRRQGYIQAQDYQFQAFFMDTKVTYTTAEQIAERAELALGLIAELDPDIVFVNDDNALKYVAVEYINRYPQDTLPFVFCGINVDPTIYKPIESLERPGGTITGALERFPYYEAFSLARDISPNARTIVLLADSSPSSSFVVDAFHERYTAVVTDSPLEVMGPIQLETFAQWQDTVEGYQAEADYIGILTYHQLRGDGGSVVPAAQVVDWTVHNSDLPEMGVITFHAEDGYMAACGVSGYRTGIYTGAIGGQILGGTLAGDIPIADPGVTETAFNLGRAGMLDITIPAAALASADEVFYSP
jgi:ABC-type uncharacterized transport system substrate-binding protein